MYALVKNIPNNCERKRKNTGRKENQDKGDLNEKKLEKNIFIENFGAN
jgi:hypothetical protein